MNHARAGAAKGAGVGVARSPGWPPGRAPRGRVVRAEPAAQPEHMVDLQPQRSLPGARLTADSRCRDGGAGRALRPCEATTAQGSLARGFLRLRCGAYGPDKVLAFNCKRRRKPTAGAA